MTEAVAKFRDLEYDGLESDRLFLNIVIVFISLVLWCVCNTAIYGNKWNYYTVFHKKGNIILMVISLTNRNQFSKFFQAIVTNPIRYICCHTTLWNINTRKQGINDKLQDTVVTYLTCDGNVNNQIQKGLCLSVPVKLFLNRWIFSKVTSKNMVVASLCVPGHNIDKRRRKCTSQSTLPVTVPNIQIFQKFHLKYVTRYWPCNLSLLTTLVGDCRSG